MGVLRKYLKPYKKQLIIGPFFKLCEAVLELMIPTLMAFVVDNGVKKGDAPYVLKTGLVMLAITVVGLLCAYICQYSASIASQGFGTRVRNGIFEHICKMPFADTEKYGTSSLVNRITNDVNVMQQGLAMIIRLFIRAPFICIGSIIMAFMLDVKLALIFVIILPVFALVIYLIMRVTIPIYKNVQLKTDKVSAVLLENLLGVRVIRAFAKKDSEQKRFEMTNDEFQRLAVRVGKISAVMNPLTALIMNGVVLAILYFGGIRVNSGAVTQGEMTAFISYASYMINALIVLANLIVLLTKAAASTARVASLLETQTEDDGDLDGEKKLSGKAIEFKNASFAYNEGSENAVEGISFAVNSGETVGIIGGTGAGKSTLSNLITRLYRTNQGEILIDGINVQNYRRKALNSKVAVVPQKAVLFSGTIADNVRSLNPGATDEEVVQALTAAQAIDFVLSKEDGINAHTQRGGSNLSGGQKQRIAIARALASKPEILILDDSSSALDYATEAKLRQSIKNFGMEMTVLIISQRVSSILGSDKILVLDQGEQLGFAPHKELLKTVPLYSDICKSQLREGENDV